MPRTGKWTVSLVVAGVVAASMAVGAGAATPAAPGAAPGATPGDALVRVAHLSPDTAGVDVYVDGQRAISNVNFETVSNYQPIPAGKHKLELRPAGAPATTKPALAATPDFASQQAYTVAGVGENAKLKGQVFTDDLSSPAPGAAKVRAIHAAVDVAAVDIDLVGGPPLGTDVAFASATGYAQVLPGRYALRVRSHADGETVLNVPDLDVGTGVVYSIAVIGGTADKPLQVLPLVDARGVEVLPTGALRTGAGGTAVRRESTPLAMWLLGGGLAAAVAGAAISMTRIRRRAA